jgi:hypothetical protein
MSTPTRDREALLAETLSTMTAAEPAGLMVEDPFDCDVLAGDAEHTLSMWRIAWSTQANQ